MMQKRQGTVLLASAILVLTASIGGTLGCGSGEAEESTRTLRSTAIAGATPSSTRSPTAEIRPTAATVPSPTPSPTASPSATPVPTATPTATASPTPTPRPNAAARAGPDKDAARGAPVSLNGSGSTDPDNERLTYTWTQVFGPDVTDGVGVLKGATPLFTAPDRAGTVVFELRVNDGHGDSPPDTVQINVMEHTDAAIFVDGDRGSDEAGDGSRAMPYATISYAINRVRGPNQDIYVMTRGDGQAYVEEDTLRPQTSISLYGGFDAGWVRDVLNNKTKLNGPARAVDYGAVHEDAWFSGFELTAAAADDPGENVFGVVSKSGSATLYVEDNVIVAGDAGDADVGVPAGSSYGVFLAGLEHAVVSRNLIIAGNGGAGHVGAKGADGAPAKSNGANGSGYRGGAGGKGGVSTANGGAGGNGGRGLVPQDGKAGGGIGGGVGDKVGAGRVGDGQGGAGGAGGNGGVGGLGIGALSPNGLLEGLPGSIGSRAGDGVGGGGGGGGAGGVGLDGGGGGGGGGGGQGGAGGLGGTGGGASIGVLLFGVGSAIIEDNEITSGSGGRGGNGGAVGTGGKGTKGGVGAPNVCSFLGCSVGRSGDGGEGGGGGSGGVGGQGGAGGGGPSYGILVGPKVAPVIRRSSITSGTGGNGGIGGAAGLGGSPGGSGGSTGGSGGCCAFLLETAGTAGSGGQGGWSYAVMDIDPFDGFAPSLSDNTLAHGAAGGGGAINGPPGEAGETNFSR